MGQGDAQWADEGSPRDSQCAQPLPQRPTLTRNGGATSHRHVFFLGLPFPGAATPRRSDLFHNSAKVPTTTTVVVPTTAATKDVGQALVSHGPITPVAPKSRPFGQETRRLCTAPASGRAVTRFGSACSEGTRQRRSGATVPASRFVSDIVLDSMMRQMDRQTMTRSPRTCRGESAHDRPSH
jgi:hypothetical protein